MERRKRIEQFFLEAFPNPDRIGCPDEEAVQAAAQTSHLQTILYFLMWPPARRATGSTGTTARTKQNVRLGYYQLLQGPSATRLRAVAESRRDGTAAIGPAAAVRCGHDGDAPSKPKGRERTHRSKPVPAVGRLSGFGDLPDRGVWQALPRRAQDRGKLWPEQAAYQVHRRSRSQRRPALRSVPPGMDAQPSIHYQISIEESVRPRPPAFRLQPQNQVCSRNARETGLFSQTSKE